MRGERKRKEGYRRERERKKEIKRSIVIIR